MSWNDPCSKCGKPRHGCECPIEPYTKERLIRWEKEKNDRLEARKICEKEGHIWKYTFIIYGCERCGETSEY